MQDIVVRKREATQKPSPNSTQAIRVTEQNIGFKKTIERTLRLFQSSSQVLGGILPKQNRIIISPAASISSPPIEPAPAIKNKPPKRVRSTSTLSKAGQRKLQATLDRSKKVAHQTKKAASSPFGKLAIFQTVTILAIFAYVFHQTSAPLAQVDETSSQVGDRTLAMTSQYQFLPEVNNTADSAPSIERLASVNSEQLPIHAWATPWNLNQLSSTEVNYGSVSAFWATLDSDSISIVPKSDWANWQAYAQQNPDQITFLTISGDPKHTYTAITSTDIRSQHIASLLKTVQEQEFDGIDINYEALHFDDSQAFTAFIKELTEVFHVNDKKVAVTLEARIRNAMPMDWVAIATHADEVRVMVYDYHGRNTGQPGAIAPIGWLKEVLDYANDTIAASKLVIGLGNYGYDWQESVDPEKPGWNGVGVSYEQAVALADKYQSPIIRMSGLDERGYDIGAIPTFTYTDEENALHSVWFEDQTSLSKKIQLVSQYKNKGIIFWSVGLGDTSFWQSIKEQ